jgi:Sigma-70, region 4
MKRVDEFDAFYHETRKSLLHQTYALTGDLELAHDKVLGAYASIWQHWRRAAEKSDPQAAVRTEVWRLLGHHGMWLQSTDVPAPVVFDHLAALTPAQRRVVMLRHLLGKTPAEIGKETGTSAEAVQNLLNESYAEMPRLDTRILERDLLGLSTQSDTVRMPRASSVRREGDQRKRRRLSIGSAVAGLALVGAGLLVVEPNASMPEDTTAVGRNATTPELMQPAPPTIVVMDEAQLLSAKAVAPLNPDDDWTIVSTSGASGPTSRSYTCQQALFADTDHRSAYARTFKASGSLDALAVQTVEVSKTPEAAENAFAATVHWAAGCTTPRTQLLAAYQVDGLGDQANAILLSQSPDGAPMRMFGVVVSRSGSVVTSLVESTASDTPLRPGPLVNVMVDAVNQICTVSDGGCAPLSRLLPISPPPSGDAIGFLSPLDIPVIPNVQGGWVGTTPETLRGDPSVTLCDEANFAVHRVGRRNGYRDTVTSATLRAYVIPTASSLPDRFGLSETIGTFATKRQALAFMRTVVHSVNTCQNRELSATVSDHVHLVDNGVHGHVWTFTFEVSATAQTVRYRVGLVRRQGLVAEVTLSPTDAFDMTATQFASMAQRAGERLIELL